MKPRAIFGSAVASLSILVVGWQLGVQPSTVTASDTTATTSTSTTSNGSSSTTTDAATDPTTTGTETTSSSAVAYTGSTVSHEYGTVTVTITVADGTLTEATADISTTHDRSENINARALPLLSDEVLASQSANVSMVSGATYTSEAYLTSLQSALDQAGL
ncbi:FMN-binding protein [Arthrobacter sp. MDT2-16]